MSERPTRARLDGRVLLVVVAVAAVSALSVWDTEQQTRHTIERLALSQGTLARAIALDFDSRLQAEENAGKAPAEALTRAIADQLRDTQSLGPPRQTLVFLTIGGTLHGLGAPPTLPAITALVQQRERSAELARDDAERLGLPRRRAVAVWRPSNREGVGVLVIATAALERLHAEREQLVSVVSITGIGLVVLALGVVAIRRDGERLRLAHELDRQRLERERDDQLARAERIAVAATLSLGISHELATPLSVISLRVEGLRRSADATQRAVLDELAQQVASMRQIMQGFLALARGDAPATVELSPHALAASAAQAVAHRFASADVTLRLEADDELPALRADETLARQALTNLLSNAAHASPAGGEVVFRVVADARELTFSVLDQGEGVHPEVSAQAMRPFVTTRAADGGSGLGLAISHEIARHHGGTLVLQPGAGGRGTEAVLRLPRAQPGEPT